MMVVDGDSIINYRERKEETYYKLENESKSVIDCNIKNIDYISERMSVCTATPPSVIANRTPPPPSQKHHFAQKHQINFCIDESHRAPSRREGADAVP